MGRLSEFYGKLLVNFCVATAAIGFVAHFGWAALWSEDVLPFTIATAVVFVALLVTTYFHLLANKGFREAVGEHFSNTQYISWKNELKNSGGLKTVVDDAGRRLAILESFCQGIGRLHLKAQGQHCLDMKQVLEFKEDRRGLLAESLAAQGWSTVEPFRFRYVNQFLVSALLFIGIIGTFAGLLHIFADPNVLDQIKTIAKGVGASEEGVRPTVTLFEGFKVAFGSSLMAYICHLAGRFSLESCDDDYEHTARVAERMVQGNLVLLFSDFDPSKTIDLSPESLGTMESVATAISGLEGAINQGTQKLEKASESIANATKDLNDAVTHVREETDKMAEALRSSHESLGTLSDRMQESLEQTGEFVENMKEGISEVTGQLLSSSQSIEAAISGLGAAVDTFLDKLDRTTDEAAQRWEDQMNTLSETLTSWSDSLNQSITDFGEGLKDVHGQFEKSNALHEQTSDENVKARESLMASINVLHSGIKASHDKIHGLVDGISQNHLRRAEENVKSLKDVAENLRLLKENAEKLNKLVIGDGDPVSLLKAIQELGRQLGKKPTTRTRKTA